MSESGSRQSRIKRCGVDDRCGTTDLRDSLYAPDVQGSKQATFIRHEGRCQAGFYSKARSLSTVEQHRWREAK